MEITIENFKKWLYSKNPDDVVSERSDNARNCIMYNFIKDSGFDIEVMGFRCYRDPNNNRIELPDFAYKVVQANIMYYVELKYKNNMTSKVVIELLGEDFQ